MLILDIKQKYLKYKYKYLHIKSQIGGVISKIWWANKENKKLSFYDISSIDNQKKINEVDKVSLIRKEENIAKSLKDMKFHDVQIFNYPYDETKLNDGINALSLPRCMRFLEKNLFNLFDFTDIDLLSIGSGNGLFEKITETIFGVNIICIDPNPKSFNSLGLETPYIVPNYSVVDQYICDPSKKKSESILLLIWPDPLFDYDIEAIIKLQPLAFIVIYGTDSFSSCSEAMNRNLKTRTFDINSNKYQKKFFIWGGKTFFMAGTDTSIRKTYLVHMGLCLNTTKINRQKKHDELKRYIKHKLMEKISMETTSKIEVPLYMKSPF